MGDDDDGPRPYRTGEDGEMVVGSGGADLVARRCLAGRDGTATARLAQTSPRRTNGC